VLEVLVAYPSMATPIVLDFRASRTADGPAVSRAERNQIGMLRKSQGTRVHTVHGGLEMSPFRAINKVKLVILSTGLKCQYGLEEIASIRED